MKQLLLNLAALLCFGSVFAQQDVIWTEDFANGLNGWRVNTILCGDYDTPEFGTWVLRSVTIDGETTQIDPADETLEWSFATPLDYTVQYTSADGEHFYVYSRYTLENGDLTSQINAAQLVDGGTAFGEATANGIVNWAANINIGDPEAPAEIARLIGAVGNPQIAFENGGITMRYTGDGVEAVYEKRSNCGTIWMWSPNGNIGYGVFGFAPGFNVMSDTRTNGTVIVNGLYNNSLADAAYNPGNPPYPSYVTELVSSDIDISAADRALSVRLTQAVRLLNTPAEAPNGVRTSMQVSNDGGATWSPAIDMNPGFGSNVTRRNDVEYPIPSAYIGDATSIRIKFTYASDFWFWGIDDIELVERIAYNMQANTNFFGVHYNLFTPSSQVEDVHFVADIQNNGGLTAEDVTYTLTVTNPAGETAFETVNEYGDIAPDELAENHIFPDALPADAHAATGVYTGTYILRHSNPDNVPASDTISFEFAVTDTLFAKEFRRTRGVFFTTITDWFQGNAFHAPNGDGWYARHISFMVDNASDVVAAKPGAAATLHLFETDGDVNGDGQLTPDEYNSIAVNAYEFTGTEDEQLITIPVDPLGGVPLTSGKTYLAIVQYDADETIAADRLAISASEDYDYSAVVFVTDSLDIYRYGNLIDGVTEEPSFGIYGFGDISPVVRLSIGNNPDLTGAPIVGTEDVLPVDYKIEVAPNPVSTVFNVKLDMPEATDVNVRFFDATGRLYFQQEYDNLQVGQFQYDASNMPVGNYFFQVTTAAGTRTEKVIIQR